MKYKLIKDLKAGDLIDVNLGEGITEEVKNVGKWQPKPGETYWYIGAKGYVFNTPYEGDETDRWRFTGNCFQTEKQAQDWKEYITIKHELEMLSDWDGERDYVVLSFDQYINRIKPIHYINMMADIIKYKSRKSAEAALDQVGEVRVRKYLFYRHP